MVIIAVSPLSTATRTNRGAIPEIHTHKDLHAIVWPRLEFIFTPTASASHGLPYHFHNNRVLVLWTYITTVQQWRPTIPVTLHCTHVWISSN